MAWRRLATRSPAGRFLHTMPRLFWVKGPALREILLGGEALGGFVVGDGLAQVGSPVARWQLIPRNAQVVLSHGPALREVLLGVDALGGFVAGHGGAQGDVQGE